MLNMFAKLVADSQFTWKIWINITTNRCIPERVARRYPCPGSGSSSPPYSLHVLPEWLLQQVVSPHHQRGRRRWRMFNKSQREVNVISTSTSNYFADPLPSCWLSLSPSPASQLHPLSIHGLGRLYWMRFLASLPLFSIRQDLLLLPSLLCVGGGGGVGSLKGFLNW